jgi:hypothetical protein
MNKNNLFSRISLKYFKDLPYLALNLAKPKIKYKDTIKEIVFKNFHFQYAFEMKQVMQDFSNPRYENMLVANDILKNINNTKINSNEFISLCESAPLDGYIVWRLSPLQKIINFNISVLELQKGNCEKIKLISNVFDYNLNVINDSIDSYDKGIFNYFTMLGVTYQLPNPINTFTHIIKNLLSPRAVFYFDFIHPYDNFKKFGFHDNGTINIDGFAGYKYILSDDRTDDENDYFLNHPTSATSTILFEKNTFRNIFKTKYNLELFEIYKSVTETYEMVTYCVKL